MKVLRSLSGLAALGTLGAAGVLVYNAWSYCCGRCNLGTFFTIGPAGSALLAGISVFVFAYAVLRVRRQRSEARRRCRCGEVAESGWHFCAHCGETVRVG